MMNEVEENKGDFKFPLVVKFNDAAGNGHYRSLIGLREDKKDNVVNFLLQGVIDAPQAVSATYSCKGHGLGEVVEKLNDAHRHGKIADFSEYRFT